MPDNLRLTCKADSDDTLLAALDNEGDVAIWVEEKASTTHVWLDREAQRQLFNWLGIVLHTPI